MPSTISKENLPNFNHEILRFARNKFAHSQDDIAEFSGIALSTIRGIEEGVKTPSYLQLEKIANIYSLSLTEFFVSKIPDFPNVPTDFRNNDGAISPNLLKIVQEAQNNSRYLGILSRETNERKSLIKSLPSVNLKALKTPEYAKEIRSALKISLNSIYKINNSKSRSLTNFYLRHQIEAAGVSIQFKKFSLEDATGLTTDYGRIPLILVNISKHKNSYDFTIGHELGHILLNKLGISNDRNVKNKIERACNIFARELFAPKKLVKETFSAKASVKSNITRLHKATLLSNLAAAYRLVETKKITKEEFKDWYEAYEPYSSNGGYSPENYHGFDGHLFAKLNRNGLLTTSLVKDSLRSEFITSYDATKILGYDSDYLDDVVRLVRQRRTDIEDICGKNVFPRVDRTFLGDV